VPVSHKRNRTPLDHFHRNIYKAVCLHLRLYWGVDVTMVAAAQLSSSMTSAMETLTTLGVLSADAIFTAEFVQKVDDLFDSLNSANSKPVNHKRF
jgi:hypothetical protein